MPESNVVDIRSGLASNLRKKHAKVDELINQADGLEQNIAAWDSFVADPTKAQAIGEKIIAAVFTSPSYNAPVEDAFKVAADKLLRAYQNNVSERAFETKYRRITALSWLGVFTAGAVLMLTPLREIGRPLVVAGGILTFLQGQSPIYMKQLKLKFIQANGEYIRERFKLAVQQTFSSANDIAEQAANNEAFRNLLTNNLEQGQSFDVALVKAIAKLEGNPEQRDNVKILNASVRETAATCPVRSLVGIFGVKLNKPATPPAPAIAA